MSHYACSDTEAEQVRRIGRRLRSHIIPHCIVENYATIHERYCKGPFPTEAYST